MTSRFLIALASLAACVTPTRPAGADPIHAIANGDYWHHDSGWIFPERIGEFVRVGVPQDIAGSSDAVAHYAWMHQDRRIVAAVDVFPADSSADGTTLTSARSALGAVNGQLTETEMPLGQRRATRVTFTPASAGLPARTLYFVIAGDWRVRIQVTAPPGMGARAGDLAASLDDFVRAQRWDTLP
jgi:hypothetical protein